jgi:hypothetical protein
MPPIILLLLIAMLFSLPQTVFGQEESFDKKTEKLQKIDGFIPLYWDAKGGKCTSRSRA